MKAIPNREAVQTLALALCGGFVFSLLHIPLSWLLGPMTAILIWREALGRPAAWPRVYREGGLVFLGYMMGITFTASVALKIIDLLPSMAVATLLTVTFGMLAGWITVKRTGISMASGLLGSIPGGLSQMTTLCDEVEDADMTVVTFMQTIRVMAVIFIVPMLAYHGLAANGNKQAAVATAPPAISQAAAPADSSKTETGTVKGPVNSASSLPSRTDQIINQPAPAASSWLHWNTLWYALAVAAMVFIAPKLHLPTPYMLGPMLGAAILSCTGLAAPQLPHGLVVAAQIAVGTYMGVSTSLKSLANWRKLLPYAIFGAVGVVFFSLGVGYLLTVWHPMSLTTAFLGSAPGGMTEMGLTGAAVGADMSVIVAYQMFRLLFILFIAPLVVKLLLRVYHAHADSPAKGF